MYRMTNLTFARTFLRLPRTIPLQRKLFVRVTDRDFSYVYIRPLIFPRERCRRETIVATKVATGIDRPRIYNRVAHKRIRDSKRRSSSVTVIFQRRRK